MIHLPAAPGVSAGPTLAELPVPQSIAEFDSVVINCRACPRLVAWRETAAQVKRAAYRDETYWARPMPGFGPADAAMLVVGLAPAAHGGNRTGRIFTGDRSGDFLFASMYEVGLASQPQSLHQGDGLLLRGVRITMPVRCAPPDNKPTPTERDTCRHWLINELGLLRSTIRSVVVLGAFGWQALLPGLAAAGWRIPSPRPVFSHGARYQLASSDTDGRPLELFGSYHVSQQNTFTGVLTPVMLQSVLRAAAGVAGLTPT